jgi:hypothetical protein
MVSRLPRKAAPLEKITDNGREIYIFEGPNPKGGTATFGVAASKLEELRKHRLTIKLIHLYHIVAPGLILTEHIFQGLNRPLMYEEDENGDEAKLIFTWSAKRDWDYENGKRFDANGLTERPAPKNTVFSVIATPELRKEKFPSVAFWVDRWTWLDASPTLTGAPIDWETRYTKRLL